MRPATLHIFRCLGSVYALNQVGCSFAKNADRLPGVIMQNLAPLGIFRVLIHAGECHRLGIKKAGMTAGMRQADRVVWRNRAEHGVRGESLHGPGRRLVPFFLMPPPTENPLARLRLVNRLFHEGDDLVPVLHVAQIEVEHGRPEAGEVAMPFDESGNRPPAREVDHPGLRVNVATDFRVCAHSENAIASNRDRFDFAVSIIDRRDFPVTQDEIGAYAATHRAHQNGQEAHQLSCVHRNDPFWYRVMQNSVQSSRREYTLGRTAAKRCSATAKSLFRAC